MFKGFSIPKINDSSPNEDSFFVSENCAAVSDGAGGCGLYSNEWSEYLIDHLPKENPILSFEHFDKWIDNIWEEFYDAHESKAKQGDGILLNKFYNEASCATIAAAWITANNKCNWLAYGDTVVFHYNYKTNILEHSFTTLSAFSNPPMLVSCKEPLERDGFMQGVFNYDDASSIFIASDALAHYILMMYELSNKIDFNDDLNSIKDSFSSNANLIQIAELQICNFASDVVEKLRIIDNQNDFEEMIKTLYMSGVIDIDDYTLVFLL